VNSMVAPLDRWTSLLDGFGVLRFHGFTRVHAGGSLWLPWSHRNITADWNGRTRAMQALQPNWERMRGLRSGKAFANGARCLNSVHGGTGTDE
jgi:hypothetical protein